MTAPRGLKIDGASARLVHGHAHGDSDQASGFRGMAEARLWLTRNCTRMAAE